MPFFWLSARITTWNCGFVKTPANPNIDGATPALPKTWKQKRIERVRTDREIATAVSE